MPMLTPQFVQAALESESVWDLGNEVLYKLCADHPSHTANNAIIAKVWLIGRSYAAAIERRREKGEFSGDEFYVKHVVPRIRSSDIDAWFQELRQDVSGNAAAALKVHKKVTVLLNEITGLDKRSFASKYLHFHFRSRFFIYDTRAEKSVGQLVNDQWREPPFLRGEAQHRDAAYARFFSRCEQLSRSIRDLIRRDLDPREVDKVLLAWSRSGGA
jgi:hypothetical protein